MIYLLQQKKSNDSWLGRHCSCGVYLYHLSRVCLKQISGFRNFLQWKICLFFIIFSVVRKTFVFFGAPSFRTYLLVLGPDQLVLGGVYPVCSRCQVGAGLWQVSAGTG